MIVDSMSWKDIADELVADLIESNVIGKSTLIVREKQKSYIKAYGDRKVRCRFKEFTIKSERNNLFYIVPIGMNKTSLKTNGAYKIYVVFFPYKRGVCVCTLGANGVKVTPNFYLPHFFDRYRERYNNNEKSEEFRKTVFDFLLFNGETYTEKVPDSKYGEDAIITRCVDGIMLGHKYGNIHLYKTFISDDMLFDDQIAKSFDMEMKLYQFMDKNQEKSYEEVETLTAEEIMCCDVFNKFLKKKYGSSRIPKSYITKKI